VLAASAVVDLAQVVRDVAAMTPLDRKARQVALDIELAESPCLVLGNELLLEQVIPKLVRNAIDAVTQTDRSLGQISSAQTPTTSAWGYP